MRRLAAIALSLLLGVILAGGHLALLQGVAWASMLLTRAGTQPLAAAVKTTFDGQHPCELCRAIAQHDHDATPVKPAPDADVKIKKAECLLPESWTAPSTAAVIVRLDTAARGLIARGAQTPPVPPPKSS